VIVGGHVMDLEFFKVQCPIAHHLLILDRFKINGAADTATDYD
jgi:hypothetical protein